MGLIWIQNVCKGDQQVTKLLPAAKELNRGSYMKSLNLLLKSNKMLGKLLIYRSASFTFYRFFAMSLINLIIQEHKC